MASKLIRLSFLVVALLGAGCYENEPYVENREQQARYEKTYYESGEQYVYRDSYYYPDGYCHYCDYRQDGSSVCGEKRKGYDY